MRVEQAFSGQAPLLILASNSPRRKQLLAAGGWSFQVLAAEVDETPLPDETAVMYVLRLAENKARQAAALIPSDGLAARVIIAADTTVAIERSILGKPADLQEAEAMLWRLRGRWHQVISGVAVWRTGGDGADLLIKEHCLTRVQMRRYSAAELKAYLATGDPLDKAGAYAIQHPGFRPVARLRGCFANVMGLPVCLVRRLLAQIGYPISAAFAAEYYRECEASGEHPCAIYRRAVYGEIA